MTKRRLILASTKSLPLRVLLAPCPSGLRPSALASPPSPYPQSFVPNLVVSQTERSVVRAAVSSFDRFLHPAQLSASRALPNGGKAHEENVSLSRQAQSTQYLRRRRRRLRRGTEPGGSDCPYTRPNTSSRRRRNPQARSSLPHSSLRRRTPSMLELVWRCRQPNCAPLLSHRGCRSYPERRLRALEAESKHLAHPDSGVEVLAPDNVIQCEISRTKRVDRSIV